jgi:starch-binding outer membrane protein, SusD/RagB family
MKNFIYTFVFVSLGLLSSCTREGINNVPYDFASITPIVADSAKISGYVANIYSSMPTGYNRLSGTSMVASSTDEAVNAVRGSGAELWGEGSWGSTALYDNTFATCYTGIRRTYDYVNLVEPNIRSIVMGPIGRKLLHGQVLFLRALYNFEIFKRFGGYPIVTDALKITDDLNIPRSNYDESVKYISDLCDSAALLLPTSYAATQLGRATKGAGLALKARLLLYAASPLFNDQTKNSDTPEHGAYNLAKWDSAAKAAAAVINLKENGSAVYGLNAAYDAFFTTLTSNKEIILSTMAALSNTVEKQNGPSGITGAGGGTCPSLELVNDYEMKTGIPFDWNNPTHAATPFANRDPRFDQSILYNGATWMSGAIETFEGGNDKKSNTSTRTGFYLRKFLSINAKWNAPAGNTNHCWPVLRYGEVLLNYSEAMNEAYGPDVDPKGYGLTARQAITQIRTRAGLTGNKDLSVNVPVGDVAKMRDAIRHERRIELAFEEHRHLDLRRWKLAQTVLSQPVHGLKIVKNANNTFTYTPIEVETRAFDPKMYLYPFPQTEISRNKNLVQNTGWN